MRNPGTNDPGSMRTGRESTMTQEQTQNTTEQEFDLYHDRYFDDIKGHIEMLNIELDTTEPESEHADALRDRIEYLEDRVTAGDAYVDNDFTASPDAWKTLATFTEEEAREKYQEWDN